jgi:EmrB/QacA subfamily drug resistance transporter
MKTITLSRNKVITIAAVGMTSLMFGLEISSVPVILPSLEKLMGCSFTGLQWIMNAYTIACTTVLMATGSLADRFGRKKLYCISIVLFGLTSLVCGVARDVSLLIVSRFLQGMGGGAMLICQIAVLSQQFREGKERAFAFGMWGIVFGAGLGFGPVVGAAIMAAANWKWVFLVHVPISLLALLLVLNGVEESRDPDARGLNVLGIFLLSASVFCLTFYITQGPQLGFSDATSMVILMAALAAFRLFLWTEKTSAYPVFDFSVFRIRAFSGALLGSMGMNFSFWPFMIYFPIYFQQALGYDVVTTGVSLLAYTIPTLVVPPLAERLSLRYRPGIIIPMGMFTIGLGFFLMRYGIGADHAGWITVLPGALLAGAGLGLTNTPVTNTTTSSLPEAQAGMASGIDMSARLITLAINIAVMGVILVQGIYAYMTEAHPGAFPGAISGAISGSVSGSISGSNSGLISGAIDSGDLYALAQKIASGSMPSGPSLAVRAALVHGFDWVMLYAGVGAWGLAGASRWVFGNSR